MSLQEPCRLCQQLDCSPKAHEGHSASQESLPNVEANRLLISKEKTDITESVSPSSKDSEISSVISTGKCPDQRQHTSNKTFASSKCLFCNLDSPTLEINLDHMDRGHGLFIPDQDYLNDIESLLGYLYNIISDFQTCLYCGSTKSTVEAVQQHMRDKGHCMLNLDENSEFAPFYDFSDSGSDTEVAEDTADYDGEASSIPKKNEYANSPRDNTFHDSSTSLHLPSGKPVLHRSQLHHHHRQPLPTSTRTAQSTIAQSPASNTATPPPTREIRTLIPRANTATSMLGVPESRQRALRAVEKQMLKLETRARDRYRWGVEKGANRQKWFKVSCFSCKRLLGAGTDDVLA